MEKSLKELIFYTYEGTSERVTHTGKRGRPPNQRVYYREGSGHEREFRVVCSEGHEMMPNFVSSWFPRNDNPDTYSFYCACMLVLLMPWRQLDQLMGECNNFQMVFDLFYANANYRM
jgi:hypothetical protein